MSKVNSGSSENVEVGKLWGDYSVKYNRLSDELSKANIDIQLLVEVVMATKTFYTYRKPSESPLSILSNSRAEAIRDILSENEELCSFFKQIDDKLNELHKIVPKESRDALYEIENALSSIVSISNDLTYQQGFQDGINLLKQSKAGRKPKYILLECESHRKDAHRKFKGSKTGWIYKLTKVLREYTDEAEADQDLTRLKSGEITEDELAHNN